jgi:uncharacterized membrane protein HdeD (DUF308 family)
MEKEINWWVPVLKGLVFFALGIFIINQPDDASMAFITYIGLTLILIGIALAAFAYYTRNSLEGYKNYLVLAIVLIVLGIFMLVDQKLAETWFSITLGLVVGFSGIMNLLVSFSIRKQNVPFWVWVLVVSLFELLIAGVFIFYPRIAGLGLITVIGVGMIIFGMANVIIGINLKRSASFIKSIDE